MIGLIDSGVGGLSVLASLESLLPHEEFLYLSDVKNFPYGSKTRAEIQRHLSEAIALLLSRGATAIVLACHAASVSADEEWKRNFPVPIIGMVEATMESLVDGKLGLLATEATIRSGVYQKAIPGLTCVECPDLANHIQNRSPDLHKTIRKYTRPLIGQDLAGVILGCTHYAFASHEIEEELDLSTRLLNPALAAAQMASSLLQNPKLQTHQPKHTLFSSEDPTPIKQFLEYFPLSSPFIIKKI